ncbi:uncharacterized protein [Arachis hypogaea]|uniref:uncharacterized protein isoform X2 n=1 Tax=Arachis hypogaea TaxID=3818 RepID=UPI003B22688F
MHGGIKACKRCTQGLEALTDQFYCTKCHVYATSFLPRFCIQVRVLDDTNTATFVLFENVASKFLGFPAADLRCEAVTKPGSQKLAATLAASVRVSDDLDEIGGVVVSTTPLNSRDATPCAVEDASMVTHTPMKWICVKSIDGGSSHVPSTASRNLLPTFDKNITKEHTDPSGMDI